ncbi:ribonuclease H [Senna tora]|uniref:Ribonuclease H n=1 Tax=Senna tora TaxID=362788 RepID=A0A835CMS3_9FABA|nr:ribonuclease H [Senna tora]
MELGTPKKDPKQQTNESSENPEPPKEPDPMMISSTKNTDQSSPQIYDANLKNGHKPTYNQKEKPPNHTKKKTPPKGSSSGKSANRGNHFPMLVNTEAKCLNKPNRPFRFEACWMQHKDFKKLLKEEWNKEAELDKMLEKFKGSLKHWNKNVFGNVMKRKKNLINRLSGIQLAKEKNFNPYLVDLEKRIFQELEEVLNQEETIWFQKARCQWIKDGDQNTKYYHTKAINRRRRNKILMLKNENGVWTEDLDEIKDNVVSFFKKLFSEEQQVRQFANFNDYWPSINNNEWEAINTPFTEEEITKAIRAGKVSKWEKREVIKYLGANLIHGRHTKQKYRHIIDKIQSKLAGWKASCLSLVGRATLAQTAISAIPMYYMQHSILPQGVVNEIEKIERGFLWGSTMEKKRLHQVSWNTICLPKMLGGLGIRSLEAMNKAFIYKLLWQMLNKKNSLWVKVISSKYKIALKPHPSMESKSSDSRMWKELCKLWHEFYNNINWEIGNGSKTKFRKDIWALENESIINQTSGNFNIENSDALVSDFVNPVSLWDMDKLAEAIPCEIIDKILEINPLNPQLGSDQALWKYEKEGMFSTSSAYKTVKKISDKEVNKHWSAIWKCKIQQRQKFLLWRLSHDRLPTRSKTASWSSTNPVNTRWTKPDKDWIKINTDGAVCRVNGKARCGGILRNSDGDWIRGFIAKLECDVTCALKQVIDIHQEDSNLNPILLNIRELIRRRWEVKMKHISRLSNGCADFLAKSSLDLRDNICIINFPPSALVPLIRLDAAHSIPPYPGV